MTASTPDRRAGFLLVDKPPGPSSHSAVQQVRRALGIGGRRGLKAGHAGTLDPFASGLLLVLVGRATRLMPSVVGHDKRYLVDVRFGARSDTDDSEGTLEVVDAPRPARTAVEQALTSLVASTEQIPPAVSAIHIDGERAYKRVRQGETVVVPPRAVRFEHIDFVSWHDASGDDAGPRVVLDVRCGSGTYMRALARDLGDAVGCAAHCEALRRLEVGTWSVDNAPAPSDVQWEHLSDPLELLGAMPQIQLSGEAELADVAAGRSIARELADASGDVAIVAPDGTLAALGVRAADSRIRPHTVFVDPGVASVRGSTT